MKPICSICLSILAAGLLLPAVASGDSFNPVQQATKTVKSVIHGQLPSLPDPLPLKPDIKVDLKKPLTPVKATVGGIPVDHNAITDKLAPGQLDNLNKKAFDLSVKAVTWPIDIAKSAFQKEADKAKRAVDDFWQYIIELIRKNLPLAIMYLVGGLIAIMAVGTFVGLAMFKFVGWLFGLFASISRRLLHMNEPRRPA